MKERNVPIAVAQVQYSLMTARNNEILDACNDAGCRLISYSPLCLGLLSGKYDLDNLPRAGNPRRQLFRELLPGAKPLLDTLKGKRRRRSFFQCLTFLALYVTNPSLIMVSN